MQTSPKVEKDSKFCEKRLDARGKRRLPVAAGLSQDPLPRMREAGNELLGLPLTLCTREEALDNLERLLREPPGVMARWICFLNAHNFNGAMMNAECREALRRAHAVYPDGVAIRVAARFLGIRVLENLPGTDLVPELLHSSGGGRCFLIGGTAPDVEGAARELERRFPAWSVVGFSTGYFESAEAERRVVRQLAESRSDLLLIGMGAPRQESFILTHAAELRIPLCICVGGLFGYWNNTLHRAPGLVRALCLEWLWILLQQPHKLNRYTIGIAKFFVTILRLRARSHHVL